MVLLLLESNVLYNLFEIVINTFTISLLSCKVVQGNDLPEIVGLELYSELLALNYCCDKAGFR